MARSGSVPVALSEPTTETVTVDFASEDMTAAAGSDYSAVSGTLTFAPGETQKAVTVTAPTEAAPEGDLTFRIRLSNATGATLPSPAFATVTISEFQETTRALITGATMIPSNGEWVYDTVPYRGARSGGSVEHINRHTAVSDGAGGYTAGAVTADQQTDFVRSVAQIRDRHANLKHISLVVAWFLSSTDLASAEVYPATTYKNGTFEKWTGSEWVPYNWRCSGLTQNSAAVREPVMFAGNFAYSGTPSDMSVVRALQHLKAQGFRVTLYPFLLVDNTGFGWRGDLTSSGDKSSWWDQKVADFLGPAQPGDFTRDTTNLTVDYIRAETDWTYRRFILHLTHLAVLAGGVDAIHIASEMRGMEKIRASGWTRDGKPGAGGQVWEHPWVDGMKTLAADARGILDAAGLTKNRNAPAGTPMNLVGYAGDWSSYSGWSYGDENCFIPHMDDLWADDNIDYVGIDMYAPMTDWTSGTTAGTNRDIANWNVARTDDAAWPPANPNTLGLGLTGTPDIYNLDYLKFGIEHGPDADFWYESNSVVAGPSTDPHGGSAQISLPATSDRLNQNRRSFGANQHIMARKKWRAWWKTQHRGIWDTGSGWTPQGSASRWVPSSKPIVFTELGIASMDRASNAPNVFYDYKSGSVSLPPWTRYTATGTGPVADTAMMEAGLKAWFEHIRDMNETEGGVPLILSTLNAAWTMDARPQPEFPGLTAVWGDWRNVGPGHWIFGKLP